MGRWLLMGPAFDATGSYALALVELGVITLDAHHDVRSLDNGPSNGTPIRGLIEEDGLPGGNVHQIGIHSFANSAAYRSYCDDAGIAVTTVADLEEEGIGPATRRAAPRNAHNP